jgi:integrase
MRNVNRGLFKRCDCARRAWPKCPDAWWFAYKPRGGTKRYRISLDRQLGRHLESKTEAESEAGRLRVQIDDGTFRPRGQEPAPTPRSALTLAHLLAEYERRVLVPRGQQLHAARCGCGRKDWQACPQARSLVNTRSLMRVLRKTTLTRHDGLVAPFEDWPVADITAATLAQLQETRRGAVSKDPKTPGRAVGRQVGGTAAANRSLTFLRAAFSWAVRHGLVDRTPFKVNGEPILRLDREIERSRRLEDGEGERLLQACGPHLRALAEAALESGAWIGELLSMQWWQIRAVPKRELFLPAGKTKTMDGRAVPVSSRLWTILEMRRMDPAGQPHPQDVYVFGNEIGQRVAGVKTAWRLACKRAQITGLHFHDLRREAGSRWLEGGVQLHTVRDWLGHTTIEKTSTYLKNTVRSKHDAMEAYERRIGRVSPCATELGAEGHSAIQGDSGATGKTPETTTEHDSATIN